MRKETKNLRFRDLDPKAQAKNVKGGVVCCVLCVAGYALRAAENVRGPAIKLPKPR